ncbi:MAG: Dabb family protein [Ruminococcaceae bacterium]|nr:Dabb family protein [Oscillospiraceae bacterium]
MVKHIIIWTLSDELTDSEKEKAKKEAKAALEALSGKIEGLIDIKLNIDMLPSSNGEMMLDTSFESESALKGYQVHPLHTEAANRFVRPYTKMRLCCDYEA